MAELLRLNSEEPLRATIERRRYETNRKNNRPLNVPRLRVNAMLDQNVEGERVGPDFIPVLEEGN